MVIGIIFATRDKAMILDIVIKNNIIIDEPPAQ
jgi:hypothetical protein